MKKYWVLAVLAAFAVGIFCGAMLLGRPGSGDQPDQGSVQPSPAAPVSPPEGEVLQLGQGEENWKYWGFQWQDHAFCYAEPLDWGAYQYPAAAGMPNQEDSPEWGVILYTSVPGSDGSRPAEALSAEPGGGARGAGHVRRRRGAGFFDSQF